MSLYNLVHDVNPLAGILLSLLNLKPDDVGRFRDCFLAKNEEALEIHVYTRNGGGNRECWGENLNTKEYEKDGECRCVGCTQRNILPRHPLYLRDADDEFDCTYATVAFKVPDAFLEPLKELVAERPEAVPESPAARFEAFLGKLKAGNADDPDVKRVTDVVAPFLEKLVGSPKAEGG